CTRGARHHLAGHADHVHHDRLRGVETLRPVGGALRLERLLEEIWLRGLRRLCRLCRLRVGQRRQRTGQRERRDDEQRQAPQHRCPAHNADLPVWFHQPLEGGGNSIFPPTPPRVQGILRGRSPCGKGL